jgi:hypothetical protein
VLPANGAGFPNLFSHLTYNRLSLERIIIMSTPPSPQPNPKSELDSLVSRYGFFPTGIAITGAFSSFDSHQRLTQYIYPLESVGGQIIADYKAGRIGDHMTVSHDLFKLRNNLMALTRNAITPGALAMSEYLKQDAPNEDAMRGKIRQTIEADARLKLSREMKLSPYSQEVTKRLEQLVSENLMQKAVSPNIAVTAAAIRNRWMGVTAFSFFLPGTLTFTLYRAPKEDRIYEIFHAAGEVVGGTVLSWKSVPHLWGACKLTLPKISARPVLCLHVLFNFGASTAGALAGGTAVDTATGYNRKT